MRKKPDSRWFTGPKNEPGADVLRSSGIALYSSVPKSEQDHATWNGIVH
jgi:hypothetical protein